MYIIHVHVPDSKQFWARRLIMANGTGYNDNREGQGEGGRGEREGGKEGGREREMEREEPQRRR